MAVVTVGPVTAPVNLAVRQGDDFPFAARYTSAGVAVDLTGWSARSQIRVSIGGEILLEITPITLGTDGSIVFRIPGATTVGPTWDKRNSAVWDLQLTDPGGAVSTPVGGGVAILHDVTRDD